MRIFCKHENIPIHAESADKGRQKEMIFIEMIVSGFFSIFKPKKSENINMIVLTKILSERQKRLRIEIFYLENHLAY